MENQFREQNFESKGSTNGHGFEIAVGHYLTKVAAAGALGLWPHPAGGSWPRAFVNGY